MKLLKAVVLVVFFSAKSFSFVMASSEKWKGAPGIVEKTLLEPGSYFVKNRSRSRLADDLIRFKKEYKVVFSGTKQRDLSRGVLVLDLDKNVLSHYLPCKVVDFLPEDLITELLRIALSRKMPVLLLTAGIHKPIKVQSYFEWNFGISKKEFRESFDLISGSAVSFSSSKGCYYKSRDLLAWLGLFIRERGEKIGPIVFLDDDKNQIKSMKVGLSEALFKEGKDFFLFRTVGTRLCYDVVTACRKPWMKAIAVLRRDNKSEERGLSTRVIRRLMSGGVF